MMKCNRYVFALGLLLLAAVAWAAVLPQIKQGWNDTGGRTFVDSVTGTQVMSIGPGTLGVTADTGLTVGSAGTQVTELKYGTLTFPSGSTSTSCTMAGLTAAHKITYGVRTAYGGGVYLKSITPGAGNALVTFSGNPTTTVSIDIVARK